MTSYMDQLADALVQQKGAEPTTSRILAQLVVDGAAGGSIPEAIERSRAAFPNLFMAKPPEPTRAPADEPLIVRVAREHREAEARGPAPVDPWANAPVTLRVLREARNGG